MLTLSGGLPLCFTSFLGVLQTQEESADEAGGLLLPSALTACNKKLWLLPHSGHCSG